MAPIAVFLLLSVRWELLDICFLKQKQSCKHCLIHPLSFSFCGSHQRGQQTTSRNSFGTNQHNCLICTAYEQEQTHWDRIQQIWRHLTTAKTRSGAQRPSPGHYSTLGHCTAPFNWFLRFADVCFLCQQHLQLFQARPAASCELGLGFFETYRLVGTEYCSLGDSACCFCLQATSFNYSPQTQHKFADSACKPQNTMSLHKAQTKTNLGAFWLRSTSPKMQQQVTCCCTIAHVCMHAEWFVASQTQWTLSITRQFLLRIDCDSVMRTIHCACIIYLLLVCAHSTKCEWLTGCCQSWAVIPVWYWKAYDWCACWLVTWVTWPSADPCLVAQTGSVCLNSGTIVKCA